MKKCKEKEINKKYNLKNILKFLIYFLIIVAVIYNITYLCYSTILKRDYFELLGKSYFVAQNNLMENDFKKNALVITEKVKSENLGVGDIIAYKVNENIRINKIFNIYDDEYSGERTYITKSNKNLQPDIEKVYKNQIIGKKTQTIWGLGLLIKILQNKITSVIIFIILLVSFGINKTIYKSKQSRIARQ